MKGLMWEVEKDKKRECLDLHVKIKDKHVTVHVSNVSQSLDSVTGIRGLKRIYHRLAAPHLSVGEQTAAAEEEKMNRQKGVDKNTIKQVEIRL